jgi:carboxymethylenebutenolidase
MRLRFVVTVQLVFALAVVLPARGGPQSVEFGVHKQMDSELFSPAGPGPYPGILLMHTAMGLEQYDLDYAQRLSDQGYVVLAPRFLAAYHAITVLRVFREHVFKAYGPSMYDDFVAGLTLLAANPKVHGSKLGAIGFSAGGYFALWLAATGKVQAGVSYYGAIHAAGGDPNLDRFRQAFTPASSPVLILHGTEDGTVSFQYAALLDQILTAKHCPHEFYTYPVGHRFDRTLIGLDQRVADDAWRKTVAFLDRQLKR